MLTILSLGAGVQSTTLLLMAIHGDLPKPDCAVFADTQWEPKAVYEHLGKLAPLALNAGIVIHSVTKGNIRAMYLDESKRSASIPLYTKDANGKQGMIRRQCSKEYKIEMIEKFIRQSLLGLKPRQRIAKGTTVEMWIGISTDEAGRMKDNRNAWITNRWPLIELGISRRDCVKWLVSHGYPEPPKSACIGCPYTDNRRWREMKDHRPEEWQDAVDFDKSIRQKRIKSDGFLHRSLVPLDEVDLSTEEERGQVNLFMNECEGICGV
jgi:hypothetical protein